MKLKERFEKLKENKKLLRVLWILALIIFIVLFLRHSDYAKTRKYYNKGVKFYKEASYPFAESNFKYALWEKHTKKQECKIRINLALSIVTPITPESVTEDNFEESISRLEEARDYLTENDCAHKDDTAGHSRKAQRLKEEIDEYIEQLKKQKESSEKEKEDKDKKSADQDKQKAEEEEKKKQQEKQNKLREEIKSIEEEGMSERTENLDLYKSWNLDLNFSDKSW